MKKMISVICALAVVFSAMLNVSADESIYITEYYSSQDNITVFTSGDMSDNISAMIAGVECTAENEGDVYHNAEKYETVFLIDSSGSMRNYSDEIKDFLAECVDKKRDNEYYSFGIFSSGNAPDYIIANENNQYALEKVLNQFSYDLQSSYIYDNLMNTFKTLYSDDEIIYRRVVLITDGNENSAKGITIDDVVTELAEHPVPVFTVTLQASDKSNVESLKNIGRLARFSHGEDIRITDGGDAAKYASVLFDSAQKTFKINIIPDASLLDGSVKAMEITDSTKSIKGEIRMVMVQTPETVLSEETTVSETTTAQPEHAEENTINIKFIIIIAAVTAAAICIAIIVAVIVKNRKRSEPVQELSQSLADADNEETAILFTRSGNTQMLIDDPGYNRYSTLILRDAADSVRTFEVQLSGDGAIVGRSSDMSNIVIDYDRSVSRKHCRIYIKDDGVYIEDLGSGNKTYVNDNEIFAPTKINNSDVIRVGRVKLKVTLK